MGQAVRSDQVRDDRWEQALEVVMRGGVMPHDPLHVTALLEMGGYNDRRAREEFGYGDLFEMGEEIFQRAQSHYCARSAPPADPVPWYRWISMGAIYYLRGIMFAMPMVVSVLAMLRLRYSLWSYEDFGPHRATGIALGTMLSFLVTGGFTQSMARRGLFYLSQREYSLARRSTIILMFGGMAVSVAAGLAFGLINLLIPFFPWDMLAFAAPYYLFLCLLWLAITILYMMKQELLFTAITAGGIAAVWYLFEGLQWPIEQAHMVGLGTSTTISLVLALWLFRRYERRPDAGFGDAQMPRWSQVARGLVPYFAFGLLYFGFLYLDRLLAWSVPGEVHPAPIWFDGKYELGLDWAILTLVIPMGLLELFINVFARRLELWLPATPASQWWRFNQRFQAAYRHQLIFLLLFSTAGGWLIWYTVGPMKAFGLLRTEVFVSPVTEQVFILGTIAYVFVTLGLLNSLILFSLNHPWPAIRAISAALMTDLMVGFILSRQISVAFAAAGLLAGAVVFAVLSTLWVHRELGRLDYLVYRTV